MPLSDYSLSYTIHAPVIYFDAASGNFGSPSTIDVSTILLRNDYGSPAVLEVSDILVRNDYGSPTTFEASSIKVNDDYGVPSFVAVSGLLQPLIFFGELIHYSENAELWADTLNIEGAGVVRAARTGVTFQAKSRRIVVSHQVSSGIVNMNLSAGIITNQGAAGPIKIDLPAETPNGVSYTLVKTANQDFNVGFADSLDLVVIGSGANNEYVETSLDSIGSVVSFIKVDKNIWSQVYETNTTVVEGFELTPLEVNTAAWYDASDSGSITIEPTNNVSQWDDKSGFANHMLQATDIDRPSVTSGNLNGLDGMVFDLGNTEWMRVSKAVVEDGPWTVIAVAEANSAGSNQYAFGFFSSSSNTDYKVLRFDNNIVRMAHSAAAGANTSNSTTPTVVDVAFRLKWTDVSPATRSLLVDGAGEVVGTTSVSPSPLNRTSFGRLDRLSPFGNTDSTFYELAIFSGILTTRQEIGLNNYFFNKWGI